MRWRGREQSENVEDRRGVSGRGLALGGGGVGLAVAILYLLLGGDPSQLLTLQQDTNVSAPAQPGVPANDPDADLKEFVSVVLKDTEDVWSQQFQARGETYTDPHLVLFTDAVSSACGQASSAVGPFYCPEDSRVYLDLAFFNDLRQRYGAPGDFAQAYVIAHEVGHHVQNLLGISEKVESMHGRVSERDYNKLSVRLELQADFLAGVWAHYDQETKHILEAGDIEEALNAATAIGDDRLQREATGRVVPDSFTHGTSAQRLRWFRKGFETGDLSQGDTFASVAL
ncbi:MAG: KPN_02809 family neutral zinc metallopeptidase [Candidatus Eiseniibacteriota bacterium]